MTKRDRQLHLGGFKEFQKMASVLSPREARNLARSTTHGVAVEIAKLMRSKAPKKEGVLRRAIKAKRRRMRGDVAISDVRIEHGKSAKHDAYHWHFVEFGTQHSSEQPYIRPTLTVVEPEIPTIYRQKFAKGLQRRLNRIAKRKGGR